MSNLISTPIINYADQTSPAAVVLDQHENIENGLLKNDLDCDGYNLVNVGEIQLNIISRVTRDIYLGQRSEDATGTGDKDSPYSANDKAEMDARLADPATWAEGGVIIIEEGEYFHSGQNEWNIPVDNGAIRGKGTDKTILTLDPSVVVPDYGINCIYGLGETGTSKLHVSDLTLNGNASALDNPSFGKINGGYLRGPYSTFENVRATAGAGYIATFQEHFGLLAEGDYCSILDCRADSPFGNYGGGLVVAGLAGIPCVGGLIRNPIVDGYRPQNGVQSGQHFAALGCLGGQIIGGLITNCQGGIYIENCGKLAVIGIEMRDMLEICIHINAPAASAIIRDLQFIGNKFEMRDDGDTYIIGIALSDGDDGTHEIYNAIIANNIFKRKVIDGNISGAQTNFSFTIGVTGRGHQLIGNICDSSLNNTNVVEDALCFGNRDEAGDVLPQIPDKLGDAGQSYEPEMKVTFTPDTIDSWYTIATGASFMTGTLRIKAVATNGYTEAEIVYDGQAYGAEGTFQQLRNSQHTNRIVDKIRMTNTDGADAAAIQLDIHVSYITDLSGPVELYFYGPSLGTIVDAPVAGATELDAGLVEFPLYSKGFDSSYSGPPAAVFVNEATGSDEFGLRLVQTSPFATIQAALDAAEDGDEILIGPGVYDEEVTVRAGTFVITLQHGAIWKQSGNAACLISANVECDFTINGDLMTDNGAACVAMIDGCDDVIIRVNGTLDGRLAFGDAFGGGIPCTVYQASGKFYCKGTVLGLTQAFYTVNSSAASLIDMDGDVTSVGFCAKILGSAGTAIFRNGVLTSDNVGFQFIDRDIEFYRCTIRTGDLAFQSGGTGVITLHEGNHIVSAGGSEISTDLDEIALDGISYTRLAKEAGTTVTGIGALWLADGAQYGTVTLT